MTELTKACEVFIDQVAETIREVPGTRESVEEAVARPDFLDRQRQIMLQIALIKADGPKLLVG